MEDTATNFQHPLPTPKYAPLQEDLSDVVSMPIPQRKLSTPSISISSSSKEKRSPKMAATESREAYREAKKVSDAIDRQIRSEQLLKEREKVAKLLVLGAAESGKTTVLKQIKIIHGTGLSADRPSYTHIVYLNSINAIRSLCQAVSDNGLSLANPANQQHLDYILGKCVVVDPVFLNGAPKNRITGEEEIINMFKDITSRIKALWADRTIKEVYRKSMANGLQDSAKYFLDNVDRFSQSNYAPSDADIVQARVRTIGVTEHRFDIDSISFRIYDVGGQRSQRKFWAPYFDDCNAIIFLVAISSFDQTLAEDPSVNRMVDAIYLFETICNHPLFKLTSMILFLNKIDVLKRKLEAGVKVLDYMPDYRGDNSFESVTSYFQKLFYSQKKNAQKEIYVHLTHATDTKQMRVIVAAVNVIVQRTNLRNSGLL